MTYDRVYLFAKMLDEPYYQVLIDKFEKVEAKPSKKMGKEVKILFTCDKMQDVPPVDTMDRSLQNIVIFDDFLSEQNRSILLPYWTQGRKHNCSVFFLSQSFYSVDKDLRGNSSYLILYKVNNFSDLRRIFNDAVHGVEWNDFIKVYHEAIKKNPHGFITVDNVTSDPSRRVREGIL
jgi:hypothetical protein